MGCNSSKDTYSNEIKAIDVLPEEIHSSLLNNPSINKEPIKFLIKLANVHMRQLETKEQCYIHYSFGKDIYTCQTRTTNRNEVNPAFDLTCEFEQTLTLESLKNHYLKISLLPLSESKIKDPIAQISIDFLTLAFGPSHHAIRFKKQGGRHYVGLLQYDIHFEQV